MFRKKVTLLLAVILAVGNLSACIASQSTFSDNSTTPSAVSVSSVPENTSDENNESAGSSTALQESTLPDERSVTSEERVQPVESSTASQASAHSTESSVTLPQESSTVSQMSSRPAESSVAPPQQSSRPAESSVAPPQQSSRPTESSAAPPQQSSRPTESSVAPPQQSSRPTESSAAPPQQSSRPTESSVAPPQESSRPVESSVVPPQESSQPTEPVVTPNETDVGGKTLYEQLFDLNSTVQIALTVEQNEMDKLQQDYYQYKRIGSKSPIYRKATMTLTVNGVRHVMEEVGIRLKGNMSLSPVYDRNGQLNLSHYKLSFNETFDDPQYYGSDAKVWTSKAERKARKNRRLATLKELDIKWNISYDETFVREIYAADLSREQNILAQHIGLTQLQFNGENYGIMKIYEPVDETFLERNLPQAALGGDLYKCGWTMRPCNYVQGEVTYGVEDKDKGLKYNLNLRTNKETSDHAALKNLLKVLAGNPSQADFEKVVDADYFANFLAVSYFLGDPDDMRNNYNNHYIYFRKDTGKAIFIVYDNDRTLGVTYGYNPDGTGMTGQPPFYSQAAGAGGTQRNPLIRYAILNSNAYLKDKYTAALQRVKASSFWQETTFQTYYDKARRHYESGVTPSVSFANVEKVFRFSLDGKYPSGDRANMSFHDYVTRIMKQV